MLNNSKDLFDVVLLFALPASGKSEVRHLLANVPEEKLQKEFHFGQTLQLDDFPYVHMMRRIDMECEKIDQPRIYYSGDETPVYDAHDNATLIELINEDYHDLMNRNVIKTDSAAQLLFDRIDNASIKAGMPARMAALDENVRAELARRLEKEARDLLDEKHKGYPEDFNNKTIVFEAARGGKDGSTMPLSDPDGYQFSLRYLCPEMLRKAVILYIQVSPEESRRKNFERTDPNDPGSILNHGVPLAVMLNDYGCDDMEYLINHSEVKDTVTVKTADQTYHIPVGIFDNRDDKTTYFRQDPKNWQQDKVDSFMDDVKKVTDLIYKNYKKD